MYGVIINVTAILVGSLVGLVLKNFLTEKISRCIEMALGYCTIILGIKMGLQYNNVVILVSCVVFGGVLGTLMDLETNIIKFVNAVRGKFSSQKNESKFAEGFTVTSVLYCTGAMAVVGSINSGLMGNHETLIMKGVLDGITSITFSAIYGIGVAFSSVPVFIYQVAITIFSAKLEVLAQANIINEITGVGGVLVTMIGINIAGIKKISVGDFLPSMLLVIVVASLWYT